MMDLPFTIVIPVRYDSTRFPGKALCMISGSTMLEHVHTRCIKSMATRVIIATDSRRIANCASHFCQHVVMTDPSCLSGTDRVAQAVIKEGLDSSEIIVNVQGDEPLISANNINQVASLLHSSSGAQVASLYQIINSTADLINPNIVKVVTDCHDKAICFSRAEIPYARNRDDVTDFLGQELYKKHIGLYAYRVSFLANLNKRPMTYHEKIERLEQMTWLAYSLPIQMAKASNHVEMDVNTHEDLEKICQIWDELAVV